MPRWTQSLFELLPNRHMPAGIHTLFANFVVQCRGVTNTCTYNASLTKQPATFSKKYPTLYQLKKTERMNDVSYLIDKATCSSIQRRTQIESQPVCPTKQFQQQQDKVIQKKGQFAVGISGCTWYSVANQRVICKNLLSPNIVLISTFLLIISLFYITLLHRYTTNCVWSE